MPKWSSEKTPSKYRHLEKRLEELNQTLNSLPKPEIDFYALSPKQRDLIEIFQYCMRIVFNSEEFNSYSSTSEEIRMRHFNQLLNHKLNEIIDEGNILELTRILNDPPQLIQKNYQPFHNPIYPPNLINFICEQQDLYAWIPQPGKLLPLQLTWVAWDELMSIMQKHGYNFELDDVSELRPLKEWPLTDKRTIVHLYIEMIASEETKNNFLAVQDNIGKRLPIRKRRSLSSSKQRYGFINGKVVRLKDD